VECSFHLPPRAAPAVVRSRAGRLALIGLISFPVTAIVIFIVWRQIR